MRLLLLVKAAQEPLEVPTEFPGASQMTCTELATKWINRFF